VLPAEEIVTKFLEAVIDAGGYPLVLSNLERGTALTGLEAGI
jgi:hypothetical protein